MSPLLNCLLNNNDVAVAMIKSEHGVIFYLQNIPNLYEVFYNTRQHGRSCFHFPGVKNVIGSHLVRLLAFTLFC